jgi:hypothetical protein
VKFFDPSDLDESLRQNGEHLLAHFIRLPYREDMRKSDLVASTARTNTQLDALCDISSLRKIASFTKVFTYTIHRNLQLAHERCFLSATKAEARLGS